MQLPLPSTSFSTSNTTSSSQENEFIRNDSKKNIFDYLVSYFENLRILGWNVPQTSIVRMEHSLRLHCSSLLKNSGKNKFENHFNDEINIENQNFWRKVFLSIFNFRLQSWPTFNFIFVFSSSLSSVSSFSSKNNLIIDGKEFENFKFLKSDSNNQNLKNLVYENDNNNNSNNNHINNDNELRNSKKRNNTEIEIGSLSDYKNENREKKEKRKTEEKQRKKENQERIKLEISEMEKSTNARIENKRKKEENNFTRNFAENENYNNHNNDINNKNNNNDGGQNENLSTLHNILGIFDFERNASDRLVRTLKTAINRDFDSISSSEANSLPLTDFQPVGSRKFEKQNLLLRHDGNENENKFETKNKNENETKNEKKENNVNLFVLSCRNEKKKFQNLLNLAAKTGIASYVQK